MIHETAANEMDPNLVLVRLGPTIDKTKLLDKSTIIGTVAHGDTFSVSFARANFEKKRDAMALTRLNRETKDAYFAKFAADLKSAESNFTKRFETVFGIFGDDSDFNEFEREALANLLGNVGHHQGLLANT